MPLGRVAVQDMHDTYVERHEYISDQAPMTPPPQELRTEDRRPNRIRGEEELKQAGRKFVARQMVGIAAKGRIAPGRVGRVADRPAPTSHGWTPTILDPVVRKRGLKRQSVELGVSPGAGKAPDVGDQLNPEGGQQREERRL